MTVHSGGHPDLLNPRVGPVQFPMGDQPEIGAWSAGYVVGIGTRSFFVAIVKAIAVLVRIRIGRFLQLVQRRHLGRGQRPVVYADVVEKTKVARILTGDSSVIHCGEFQG